MGPNSFAESRARYARWREGLVEPLKLLYWKSVKSIRHRRLRNFQYFGSTARSDGDSHHRSQWLLPVIVRFEDLRVEASYNAPLRVRGHLLYHRSYRVTVMVGEAAKLRLRGS